MAGLPLLTEAQLRKLAYVLYHQETNAISNLKFGSELDRAAYLRNCKDNYDTAISLLDSGAELDQKYAEDEVKGRIAHDVYSYIVRGVGFACEAVRNYSLRLNYMHKIKDKAQELILQLEELGRDDVEEVKKLANTALQFRNAMIEYTRNYQSAASRNFSRWLKSSGLGLDELVQRYQNKRGFSGQFEQLEDTQKIEVFEDIIEASGRSRVWVNRMVAGVGVAGIGVILLTAGIMVWDIVSSEYDFHTATRDALIAQAPVAGAFIADVVTTAVAEELALGLELSPLFVTAAGMLSGIAGAFIVGALVGLLVDLIFQSGGSAPLSMEGIKCYIAPMPDCAALAYQILHEDDSSDKPQGG